MKTFLLLFGVLSVAVAGPVKEITNQNIYDTVMSLIQSYKMLDNKLERHEYRERALGEMVKKALQGLQKGQKAFEPMNGIFSRLDERVGQIETMIMAQEEKYNTQSEKVTDSLDDIFKWMIENNECFKQTILKTPPPPPPVIAPPPQDNKELLKKIEQLSQNVKDSLKTWKEHSQQTEKMLTNKLATMDSAISKMNEKLTEFYVTVPPTPSPDEIKHSKEFEMKIETQLADIKSSLKEPFDDLRKITDKIIDVDRSISETANGTLNSIQDLKADILATSEKALQKITSRINESVNEVGETIEKIALNFNETAISLHNDLNVNQANLTNALQSIGHLDVILLKTSESMLNIQKKIEHGNYQIVQKVSDVVKSHNADLNETLHKRLDDMDASMLVDRMEALKNLTRTVEFEIGPVWRQINLMYTEMMDSKDVLKVIEKQTATYINGTVLTINDTEKSLGMIGNQIFEIESNLNFLMGRLSLVTQEFNGIKTGLGAALTELRNTFRSVQDNVKNVTGKQPIPDDQSPGLSVLNEE